VAVARKGRPDRDSKGRVRKRCIIKRGEKGGEERNKVKVERIGAKRFLEVCYHYNQQKITR